ncbi:HAD family hydrolase [Nocardia sp. alder85J]|uniref:HAD family hydrolase n=1 Tax=Nocardia sp. alder85J TaxID=2862949 RepID=UPI001CD208C2|nr:HAD family hydrolase [Nocardia sp. alder85J]MCX4092284.1 hypothetical protein [Nocardia sp. alder85J]
MTVAPRLLLLDFDGVLADSVAECMAVTWYSDAEPADRPLAEQIAAVPVDFADRFQQFRPFARTLDDFLVAKRSPGATVTCQAEFDTLKDSISGGELTAFTRRATALRAHWRTTRYAEWLGVHTVFDGVAEVLGRHSRNVFVITAKDAASSWEILRHFGLDRHVVGIAGDVSDKALAARCLCLGRGVDITEALFIDDNVTNVHRVQAAGVPSRWATWGWTTPEHRSTAVELGLTPVDPAGFIAI